MKFLYKYKARIAALAATTAALELLSEGRVSDAVLVFVKALQGVLG